MNEDIERRIVLLWSSFFILCEKKQKRPTNKLFNKIENHFLPVLKMISSKKIFPIPQDTQLTLWLKSALVQVPAVPIFHLSFVILCHNL